MRSPRAVFFLLLAVIAGSIYWVQLKSPRIERIDSETSTRDGVIKVTRTQQEKRLDFSGGEKRKFQQPTRDLFGMLYPAPPVEATPKRVTRPAPRVKKPVKVETPPPPPPPRLTLPDTTPKMPSFQVIGSLEKKSGVTAFVMLQGDIYLLRQGQQFAEEYQVAALSPASIRIIRRDGAGEVTLPLTDKADTGVPSARPTPQFPPVQRPAGHPPVNQGT